MTSKQITNITFGYADSEDRLWARLILSDQTEERLWLTRALCQACCNAVSQLLKDTCEILPHEEKLSLDVLQKLNLECSLISETTADTCPPQPNHSQLTQMPFLCHTIKITPQPLWEILFIGNHDKEFALSLNRQQAFKFLIGLSKQAQQAAQWNINFTQAWFKNYIIPLKS